MNIWIVIAIVGVVITVIGMVFFVKRIRAGEVIKKSTFLVSIFIPLFVAFSYSENFNQKYLFNFSFWDMSLFYFMGMLSGFFLAVYLIQQKYNQAR
ncbi:hypothetical protein ACFLSX_01005 [Calditrichota bacterium]